MVGHLNGDGEDVLDRRPEVILFLRLMATPQPLAGKVGSSAAGPAEGAMSSSADQGGAGFRFDASKLSGQEKSVDPTSYAGPGAANSSPDKGFASKTPARAKGL